MLVANSDGLLAEDDQVRTRFVRATAWRSATPGCRPAPRRPGRTLGLRALRRDRPRGGRRAPRRDARAHDARRASRAARASCPSCSSAAPAACCSTRRAVTGSRPTSSTRTRRCSPGQVGELVASPLVTLVDDGTLRARVGHATRSTTKARPRSATCSSRTACSPTTCGTSCARARRAARAAATAGARPTSTCRWCA